MPLCLGTLDMRDGTTTHCLVFNFLTAYVKMPKIKYNMTTWELPHRVDEKMMESGRWDEGELLTARMPRG